MKSVTTKTYTTLLLALLAALWSTNAWAGIKIHVKVEGNTSAIPNIYAWYTPTNIISSAWPGDQMTETTTYDGITWRVAEFDASNFNILFNYGDKQSSDKVGINEDRYYAFNTNTGECYNLTNQYVIPSNATYVDGKQFVYYVNDKDWETPYAHVYNSSGNITGDWPGVAMTKVENSVNLWKWESTTSQTPANIIFNNNNQGSQSATLPYTNGGYYNSSYQITTITQLQLNAANFPDANFRAALAEALNVNEGDIIYPNNVKVLDVSGKGISDLTGIANFTNLEEMYAGNNNLTHLVLTGNSKLQILDIKNNTNIKGFSSNSATSSNNYINMPPSSNPAPLKKLDASGCTNFGYFRAIHDTYGISSLEWLSLNGCTAMDGWSSGITAQTGLKYLDLTNSGQNANHNTTASRISVTGLTGLETLILADNTSLCSSTYLDLTHNTNLKYLDLSNTGLNETRAKTTLNTVALSNLETLKINNNSSLKYAFTEKLPRLKHFEIADGDLYFTPTYQLSTLTPANNPNLEYLDISNAKISSSANPIDGFQNLKTVIAGSNPSMPKLTINNCPAIESIDISNNTSETILSITNSGLTSIPSITATGATSLYKLDLTGNAFTDVPTTGIASLTTLVMNDNQLSDLNVSESNIQYLYAQNNNFGGGEYEMPETSLVGLDLGNNGFTKFKMTGNTTLKSLALSDNDALTEIELHGNTQLTQTSPDGVIESDNGLYIKGLSSLQTLNIENSSFNKLGQQNSLQGVTGLTRLQARHNKFTTFTNGVYALDVSGSVNYRIPDPTESSLEHLIALEYLDLAYNELRDSVHLYKNVALKHLDVSHNNEIHGVIDGTININDAAAVTAMKERKGRHLMKYGKIKFNGVKKTYGVNASPEQWEEHYTNMQALRERPFDLRVCDLNDTTGIYHLDLSKNVNLEWLDISYTNIHNTAAGPTFMCPGWMDKDWVTDIDALSAENSSNSSNHRAYVSWHTFVYFIPCSKLKVIHADHNNMRSLGIRYFPELDTLTSSYMYGDSELMRDFPTKWASNDLRYNMGNTALSTTIKKFNKVNWAKLDDDGNPAIVLWGPNGTESTSDVYPNKLRYWDVSYSGFNEIRLYPGSASADLPYLEYVNVSGNPLNFQVKHYNSTGALVDNSTVSNYNSLDVTYCPNIRTVLAENCADLPIVRAHNRTKLDTLYLSNDPNLKTLYVQNDPLLKTNFQGLNTLTGLETLFGYNNTQWGNDITFASNTALKNLWISNIGASQLNVATNTALQKLRAYDNSLSTLNVGANTALTWLDVARNKIPSLDLRANATLQYFNCSNSDETLVDQSLAANSHNGGEADDVKPVTSSHSASDTGNSLSDLVFNASAPIADVRANSNDLHCINGSFGNLTHIEFAHNHINGIDLSAATNLNADKIVDDDNGRAITAECAKFIKHGTAEEVTVYYFQLENIKGQQLTGKKSIDSKKATRYLGEDGFELTKILEWDGTNAAPYVPQTTSGIRPKDVTVDPSNMADYLGADVEGTVVVLKEDAQHPGEGRATYSYKNGVGNSTFYLDWEANADLPTAINVIEVGDGLSIAGSYGGLTINGADGTVVGVYDMSGRQVASETISGGKATITGLTPGIYVVNGQKVVVK